MTHGSARSATGSEISVKQSINRVCFFHRLATVAALLNEGSMRLLVVEDEARITEVLRVALIRTGFAVDAVATVAGYLMPPTSNVLHTVCGPRRLLIGGTLFSDGPFRYRRIDATRMSDVCTPTSGLISAVSFRTGCSTMVTVAECRSGRRKSVSRVSTN
jgi:hypothetical protein